MTYCADKDIEELVRRMVRIGWRYRRGSKHGQLWAPGSSRPIIVPGTPSDRRCLQNFHADVRRAMRETSQCTSSSCSAQAKWSLVRVSAYRSGPSSRPVSFLRTASV